MITIENFQNRQNNINAKTMEFDTSDKCRACLLENKVMFALFDNYENDLTLAHIIQSFLNIQLDMYDNLPKGICQECATLLIRFYNFSIIFERNNKKLQHFVNDNINCFLEGNSYKVELEKVLKFEECDTELIKDQKEDNLGYYDISKTEVDANVNSNNIYSNNAELTLKVENSNDFEEIVIRTTTDPTFNTEDEKHKCNVCNKQFKNLLLLKKHLQLHIHNRKFICEVCGYVSLKKSYLADHMETHTVDKLHTCNFCGKSFRRRSTFARHKKIHTNPMEIVCEMCGQKFTDRGTLKTHILLLHIKSKNFKCIVCNRTFALKATLEKHLRRHRQKEGAAKNFTCGECNMQYFDKSSLKRHYVSKHSGEDVKSKCQYCYKECMTKANLHKHISMHHK